MNKVASIILTILLALTAVFGVFYFYNYENSLNLDIKVEDGVDFEKESDWDTLIDSEADFGIFSANLPQKISKEIIDKYNVSYNHKVPYTHINFCNLREEQTDQFFIDFNVTAEYYDGDFLKVIKSKFPYVEDLYLDENNNPKFSEGSFEKININGEVVYKVTQGVEGCGKHYYIISNGSESMLVTRDFIPPFNGNFTNEMVKEFSSIEDVITPAEEEYIFNDLIKQLIENINQL